MRKIIFNKIAYIILIIMSASIFFTSCKKNIDVPTPPPTPTATSDEDSLKYLMYNIMQVSFVDGGRDLSYDLPTYYWYSSVPKLDPFSPTYKTANELLAKMKTYAINPQTNKPFDKYSFLDNGAVSDEIQGGVAGDLGMQVSYASDGTNYTLYVLFADKNSPAGLQGVTRGWQITAVNGDTNIGYDGQNGTNVQKVTKAVYSDDKATFTFKTPQGTIVTKTFSKATYQINPVLFDTVYSKNGQNIGYFVFNTFSNVSNSNGPTFTRQELDRVFTKFSSANISNLIVDLRYNGGGSVSTAEYLDAAIAPATVAGKLMYKYLYNDKLTARAKELGLEENIFFKSGGKLNLSNVFFIGGRNTASASELTLNNLKPYMNVKLVGQPTYGKPVGFFAFTISIFKNKVEKFLADLYAINFETRNAANQGGYFDGITPDITATDFINVPWGNSSDDNLQKIFSYLGVSNFQSESTLQRMQKDPSLREGLPSTFKPLRFNGMVDYKRSQQIESFLKSKNPIK